MIYYVTVDDSFYKIHNISYLADAMIVLYINLCHSKVLSIITQCKFDTSFALSLDSTVHATGIMQYTQLYIDGYSYLLIAKRKRAKQG